MKSKKSIVQISKQHQQGIVLVSCVIFLLLILLMLRISLSSSRLSEQKAGIDLEILSAEESAQLAMRDAEQAILNIAKQAKTLLTSLCLNENDKSKDCEEAASRVRQQAWLDAWNNTTTTAVSTVVQGTEETTAAAALSQMLRTTSGYYAGIAMANACGNKPSWQCINWNPEGKTLFFAPGYDNTATQVSRAASTITTLSDRIDIAPRYIIERFLPGEVDMPAEANMLLRVTAVGYGYSAGENSDGVTSVMYQANYTL